MVAVDYKIRGVIMKLDDIVSVAQVISYWNQSGKELKPATSIKLKLITDAIKPFAASFDKQRAEIKEKHKIEDGQPENSEEVVEFKRQLQEVLNTEVDFNYPVKLSADELGDSAPMQQIFMLASAIEQ